MSKISKDNSKKNSKDTRARRGTLRLALKTIAKTIIGIKDENAIFNKGKKLTFKERLIMAQDLERAKQILLSNKLKHLKTKHKFASKNRIGQLPKRYTNRICPNNKFESLSAFLKRI